MNALRNLVRAGRRSRRLRRLRSTWRTLRSRQPTITLPVPGFESHAFDSGGAFEAARDELTRVWLGRQERERGLVPRHPQVAYEGRCGICARDVTYRCRHDNGRAMPDWREGLLCPCRLSTRLRGSLHFMLDVARMSPHSKVYVTEQTTRFFELLREYNPGLTGSEYLRDGTTPGASNAYGIRHEDVTALAFADETFDVVGCFEVLEHVPDYQAGLRELCRVLKRGGHLVATFPFGADLRHTRVRARVTAGGEIEHVLEPEYHGDPVNGQGALCFYHFGWDVLEAMRDAGFSEAHCHVYWSWERGYLGELPCLFHAVK